MGVFSLIVFAKTFLWAQETTLIDEKPSNSTQTESASIPDDAAKAATEAQAAADQAEAAEAKAEAAEATALEAEAKAAAAEARALDAAAEAVRDPSPAKGAAKEAKAPQNGERRAIDSVLVKITRQRIEELSGLTTEANQFAATILSDGALIRRLEGLGRSFYRVKQRLPIIKNEPSKLEGLKAYVNSLKERLTLEISALESLSSLLEEKQTTADSLKNELKEGGLGETDSAAVTLFNLELDQISQTLAAINPELNQALETGSRILKDMEGSVLEIEEKIPGAWQAYYAASLARGPGARRARSDIDAVKQWAKAYASTEGSYILFPKGQKRILDALLRFFFALALTSLVGIVIYRSYIKKPEKKSINDPNDTIKNKNKNVVIKKGAIEFDDGNIYDQGKKLEIDIKVKSRIVSDLVITKRKLFFIKGYIVDIKDDKEQLNIELINKINDNDDKEEKINDKNKKFYFKNGVLLLEVKGKDSDDNEITEKHHREIKGGALDFTSATSATIVAEPGLAKITQSSWIWMILGVSLLVASKMDIGSNYLTLKLPGVLMLVWGLATLSWRLRVAAFPRLELAKQSSPLARFYPAAAFGTFFLFVDFPAGPLTTGWAFILISYVAWLKLSRKTQADHFTSFVERLSYGSSFYFALASLALTFMGYTRLAILTFTVLFTVVNFVTLASALMALVKKVSDLAFDAEKTPISQTILLSMAAPVAFVLSFACAIPWLWAIPGLDYMIKEILKWDYKIGGASFAMSRLVVIVILFVLFRSFRIIGQKFLEQLPKSKVFEGLKNNFLGPLKIFYAYAIWTIFTIVSLVLLGFNFTSLAVVAGGLSVGFGLGLQAICGNLLSGVFLMLSQSIKTDDFIEIDGVVGTVKSINMRTTEIETQEKSLVIIPNYNILSSRYINWTRNQGFARRKITVLMSYEANVGKVIEKLKASVRGVSDVKNPLEDEPWAVLEEYGENSMVFALYVTITDVKKSVTILSSIRERIKELLSEDQETVIYAPSLDINVANIKDLTSLVKEPIFVHPESVKTVAPDVQKMVPLDEEKTSVVG
ncbi:MAG: mechanosensitive ion channel [Deltaproteobacteria bacterium]|nr:mechanosensitive ion channel [Deltaproteobacteria bacterium]